ncbi:SPFH domain-containing protein, partial [Escherichia coli]|uniref:SPFH domain-containing protein n=1 Tax=Escherichia coli TaxID=562 RepID=UPI00207B67DE
VVVLPFLSYYTVNEGERGILLRYGKILKVAEPGLVFKIPFRESVEKIYTSNQAEGYTGIQDHSGQRPHGPKKKTKKTSKKNNKKKEKFYHTKKKKTKKK